MGEPGLMTYKQQGRSGNECTKRRIMVTVVEIQAV